VKGRGSRFVVRGAEAMAPAMVETHPLIRETGSSRFVVHKASAL
jgi:predicted ribosome-associated RNA-binding protein Tma20